MYKKLVILCMAIILSLSFGGCFEGVKNGVARDGGFFATSKGDYIIINTSGNIILDIYKLKNKYVDNQQGSDGVGFVNNDGNYVLLQGDVKVVRINNSVEWDKYIEYHYEDDFMKELNNTK